MTPFKNPFDKSVYEERLKPREEDIRGPFFRDQTAIIHSLPFRRLKHKAQVFFDPNNDHVCTRIEHAFHVATIAKTIAMKLELDDDLAYTIGLGHDLGHAPFGHAGESALNSLAKGIGFIHEIHGLRVVDVLGNRGVSLNLTYGVRDGIICHCGEVIEKEVEPREEKLDLKKITQRNVSPCSYEGCVVRMSDRIAYLGRDLEDAIYGKFVNIETVPKIIRDELGTTNGEIINTLVLDVINTSLSTNKISISDKYFILLDELYDYSFKNIYEHKAIKRYKIFCERIIVQLFEYLKELISQIGRKGENYRNSPVPLDKRFGNYLINMEKVYTEDVSNVRIITDYIAGMTDGYALRCIKEITLPDRLDFDNLN